MRTAAGFLLFSFGYGMIWVGVERFRGNNISLITAFGASGGQTTKVTGGGNTATRAAGGLLNGITWFSDPVGTTLSWLGL